LLETFTILAPLLAAIIFSINKFVKRKCPT